MKEEGDSLSECLGSEIGKGTGVQLRDLGPTMGGAEDGRVGQPLRPDRQTGAQQLVRGISRCALRRAKGRPDPLKKNRKNK